MAAVAASSSCIVAVRPFLPITETRLLPTTTSAISLPSIRGPNRRRLFPFLLSKSYSNRCRWDWDWRRSPIIVIGSVADDLDVVVPSSNDTEEEGYERDAQTANLDRGLDLVDVDDDGGGGGGSGSGGGVEGKKITNRAINSGLVLSLGTLVITRLLTIDRDYWHGWTLYEILRYAPEHNWTAYEDALETNPVLAKMVISGVVYSIGDWIAQCYEGKPLFEFDRARMFRSGLVGFTFHGSLSHYYYYICEALFPFQDWWVVPAKVLFDQTVWSAIWNSIYFVLLGFLRRELPSNIFSELKATFWPMLTAGWKLWPFAHLITYGVIPVEQRLLWVDCVELVWVTILSTYSNEKSEARSSDTPPEMNTKPPSIGSEE